MAYSRSSGWRGLSRTGAAGLLIAIAALLLLGFRAVHPAPWLDAYVSALVGAVLIGAALAVFGLTRSSGGSSLRAKLFPLILLTASIALMLFALEWIARFAFWDVHSAADARTYLALRMLPTRHNALGYRDAEIPPKTTEKYRIMALGDSITWGQGVEENERFTNLLQNDLGPRYEVINFGMRAHDMPEHLQKLDQALPLSPDFILLQLYLNDFETRRMIRPVARPLLPWPDIDRRMLASSVLYGLLSTQWRRYQEATGKVESFPHYLERYLGDPSSEDSLKSFGMLHEFLQKAKAAGVPTGVVIFPNPNDLGRGYPYAFIHNRIREVCLQEHIEYVDLEPTYASMGDPRGLWANRFDQHPNARAHRRAEEELLAKFGPVWRQHIEHGAAAGEGDARAAAAR